MLNILGLNIIFVILFLLLASGCGEGEAPAAEKEATSVAEKTGPVSQNKVDHEPYLLLAEENQELKDRLAEVEVLTNELKSQLDELKRQIAQKDKELASFGITIEKPRQKNEVDAGIKEFESLGEEWVARNPYSGNKTAIKKGESAYNENCARCHGLGAISGGITPDLRLLPHDAEGDEWYIYRVRKGSIRNGMTYMPKFAESDGGPLSQEDLWAIRAWLETIYAEK